MGKIKQLGDFIFKNENQYKTMILKIKFKMITNNELFFNQNKFRDFVNSFINCFWIMSFS